MELELNKVTLFERDYRWICEAFGYDTSASIGAAANRLTLFRQQLSAGGLITIRPEVENVIVNSVADFDTWVDESFPFLADTFLYPRKQTFGKLSDLIFEKTGEVLSDLNDLPTLETKSRHAEVLSPINAFLQAMALINLGANHEASYRLERIENVGTLNRDLEFHFKNAMLANNADWQIITEQHNGRWEELVKETVEKWFFKQEFSPKVENDTADIIIETLVTHLQNETTAQVGYRLKVTPPIFYEVFWEDIILEADNQRWLLHFGFSD